MHCAGGSSRSPTFVIAYLMKREGWCLKDTLQFTKEKRLEEDRDNHNCQNNDPIPKTYLFPLPPPQPPPFSLPPPREVVEPNEGFAAQLVEFEKELRGENSMQVDDFEFSPED